MTGKLTLQRAIKRGEVCPAFLETGPGKVLGGREPPGVRRISSYRLSSAAIQLHIGRGCIIMSPIGGFHMGNPGQKGFPVRALLAFVRPDDAA